MTHDIFTRQQQREVAVKEESLFGRTCRRAREKVKLSQSEAARKLRCSRTYLIKIERGTSVPSLSIFMRMCELYETTPNRLLQWSERKK